MLEEITETMWKGTVDEIVEKVKELQLDVVPESSKSELTWGGVQKQLERLIDAYSYMAHNNEDKKLSVVGKIFYLEFSEPLLKDNDKGILEFNGKLSYKFVYIIN